MLQSRENRRWSLGRKFSMMRRNKIESHNPNCLNPESQHPTPKTGGSRNTILWMVLALPITCGALPLSTHGTLAADTLGSGEGLLNACESFEKNAYVSGNYVRNMDPDGNVCFGFIGAMQQISGYINQNRTRQFYACLPPNSTTTQLIRVFIDFAQHNPQILHERASNVVILSFQSAFPCGGRD